MLKHKFGSILSDKYADDELVKAIANNNVFNNITVDNKHPAIDELTSTPDVIIAKRNIKNIVIDAFYECLNDEDDKKLMDILYSSIPNKDAEIIIKGGGACRIYNDKFKKAVGSKHYDEKISDIDVSLESENLNLYDLDKVAIKTLDNIRIMYYNYIKNIWDANSTSIKDKVIGVLKKKDNDKNKPPNPYYNDIVAIYNDQFSIDSQLYSIKNEINSKCDTDSKFTGGDDDKKKFKSRLLGINKRISLEGKQKEENKNKKKSLERKRSLVDHLIDKLEYDEVIANNRNETSDGRINSINNCTINNIYPINKDKDILIFYKKDDNDIYIRYAYKTDEMIQNPDNQIYSMNKKNNNFLDISFNTEFTLCKATIDKFSLARLRMCLMLNLTLDVDQEQKEPQNPDVNQEQKTPTIDIPVFIELYDISVPRKKKESYLYKKSGYYFSTNIDTTISFTQIKEKQKAYSLEYVIKDLINVLYVQQYLPWLDKKYEKRIKRIFYYSMIYDLYVLSKEKCIENFDYLAKGIENILDKTNPEKNKNLNYITLRSIITGFQLLSYNLKFKHSSLNYFTENNVVLLMRWYFGRTSLKNDETKNYNTLLMKIATTQKCPDYSIVENIPKELTDFALNAYDINIENYLQKIMVLCKDIIIILKSLN